MELKDFRMRKGLTQEELARQMGYTLSMYAQVERGQTEPSRNFMRILKNLYPEISIDEIFFAKK